MSIRDKIRSIDDLKREVVEVPEWASDDYDGKVVVKSLTGTERARFIAEATDPESGDVDQEKLFPAMIVRSARDPDTDEHLFTEEDVAWLADKNAGVLQKLGEAILRVSGMDGSADTNAAKS